MKFSTALLSIASAASVSALSVAINATTADINNPNGGFQIISNDLYSLVTYDNLAISKLQLVQGQQIPPEDVECRMYKDAEGTQPGSLPFSGSTVAYVSTNAVNVGAILCYAIQALPASS